MFLADTRIIQRHAGLAVHAQRHEVMFKDGTAVGLHPVAAHGEVQMFLRAIHHQGLQWLVFDLRHLAPEIEQDVLRLHKRDTPGVVFYSLRQHYPTAQPCIDRILAQRIASWWHCETDPALQLAAA